MEHPLIEDRGCGPMLKGKRIHVNNIFPYLSQPDYSDERMLELYPITAEELRALKDYIDDRYEQVKEANRIVDERIGREIAAQQTPENIARWEASHRRLQQMKIWYKEREENPALFPTIDGETPDVRRERMFRSFDEWLATRPAALAEAG